MTAAETYGSDLAVRCQGTNKRGEPCRAVTVQANGWCRMHDPALVDKIARERSAGGKRTAQTWSEHAQSQVERNVRKWFRPYEEALEARRLVTDQRTAALLETPFPDLDLQMRASERVLDRVYGKPTTRAEVSGQLDLQALMADTPQAITDTDF